MGANKRYVWSLRDTAEYKRGEEQLREWHERCTRERDEARAAAHKREVAETLAWAKATAKRRLAEARTGGAK